MLNIDDLIANFFQCFKNNEGELYNEFSLQHELGIFLRQQLPSYKIQFERNVSFFNITKTIKKEIDIVIYNDTERYAIELKYPLNGQYPEQMYSFVRDIKFMEELKENGFTQTYAICLIRDKLFYEGKNTDGIYSFFRDEFVISGIIHKPTGNLKGKDFIKINGCYKIQWINCLSYHKYYLIKI
ncbi:MAG: hypothetical protein WBO70_00655 [Erysipelotrichaceae bacterium]